MHCIKLKSGKRANGSFLCLLQENTECTCTWQRYTALSRDSECTTFEAEGILQKDDIDIFKLAGENTAWVETFHVTVNDGSLTIQFVKGMQEPKVCAIEIDFVPPAFNLYINAGSGDHVDSAGNTWVADTYFTGGSVYILQRYQPIAGTVDDPLYKTERYGSMRYDIPVPFNGGYTVKLHYAETYAGTKSVGARIFNVEIENEPALSQLDIFATVGSDTALIESFETEVSDGTLSIKFIPSVENPKVNAIEIHSSSSSGGSSATPAPSPAPTTTPPTTTPPISSPTIGGGATIVYRVNAGGSSYTDTLGQVWEADTPYVSFGRPFTFAGASIAGTDDDALFRSERYDHPSDDPMRFDFEVENGSYQVRLGFTEVYGLLAGDRVFDVIINDQMMIKSHDIYAKVGANTADIEEFTTEVTDGVLTVTFDHVVENPKASEYQSVQLKSLSLHAHTSFIKLSTDKLHRDLFHKRVANSYDDLSDQRRKQF